MTMQSDLPTFVDSKPESVRDTHQKLCQSFDRGTTRDIEFRLVQLRKLYWSVKDHEEQMFKALRVDLNKAQHEAALCETVFVLNEIVDFTKKLKKWAKDEPVSDVDINFKLMKPRLRKDPLGVVLIIGAYNYPFQLTFLPFVAAIAAGNTVVLKPSETSPNCAAVTQSIVARALDPSCYEIVQGGIPETQALLDCRWDKVCFTGGAQVGKIVSQAVAPKLTPLVLELGGQNPAFVTKNANVALAARRLVWGKTLNAGQTCVSHNYALVHEDIVDSFVIEMKKAIKDFFPDENMQNCEDYPRIVNRKHFERITRMIADSKGKILGGGGSDEKDLYIEPTIIKIDDINDSTLTQESFGPILPVLPYRDLDAAIKIANTIDPTPLACFPFGSTQECDKILSSTRSGGASINDSFMHASIREAPVGGVGTSGMGAYRGLTGFNTFSHHRVITTTPSWVEKVLAIRYAPFTPGKTKLLRAAAELRPDFDRQGRKRSAIVRWLVLILTLGHADELKWPSSVLSSAALPVGFLILGYLLKLLSRQD